MNIMYIWCGKSFIDMIVCLQAIADVISSCYFVEKKVMFKDAVSMATKQR